MSDQILATKADADRRKNPAMRRESWYRGKAGIAVLLVTSALLLGWCGIGKASASTHV